MTIADAFNEITIAQGGTPNYSGTIASAIDALNDALAGSDQPAALTIEGAVRLLGQHIGGSVSGTIEITENGEGIDVAQYAYADVNVSGTEYGAIKNMTFKVNGAPDVFNLTIMTEEGLQQIGNIIVFAGSTSEGEYEAAAGTVIAVDTAKSTDTATMTIDGGDPQSLRLIVDEEEGVPYFVFTVPSEGESIVINITSE